MIKVILKNAGSNTLVMIVKICISFIMAPVIVHGLGNYDYGLWEIVFSLIGYMGLLDIGMRPAVVRYVAKFKAENDKQSLDNVFSTAVTFNAVVGATCCVGLLLWAYFKPELLAESATSNVEKYVLFLIIISTQVVFQFPGYVAECFLEGHQRYYLKNNVILINAFVGTPIIYCLLTNGFGLLGIALVRAITTIFRYIVYFVLLKKEKYGAFYFDREKISIPTLKMLVWFGAKSFVQSTASTISGSVGVVVLGFFMGPAVIPFYTIPARLISYIRELSMVVTNVFLPVFSHLQAEGELDKLRKLFISSTKYITGFTFPASIGAYMLGPSFINRWIGSSYGDSVSQLLFLLTVGFMLLMMNPLHQRYLTGIGRINFLARIRIVNAVLLIVFTVLFVKPFGKEGVAAGFLLTSLIIEPLVLVHTCRQLQVTVLEFFKKVYLRIIIPNVVLALALFFCISRWNPENYWSILLVSLAGGILYLMLFLLISVSSEERVFLVGKIKKQLGRT